MIFPKRMTILAFLMIGFALTAFGQTERNPKGAYFEVGKDETSIKEWLVIGSFPGDLGADFLQAAGGEAKVRPYEGMTVAAPDGKTDTWKRHQSRNLVDFDDPIKLPILVRMETTFQSELDADNPYLPSSFLPPVKILYKSL